MVLKAFEVRLVSTCLALFKSGIAWKRTVQHMETRTGELTCQDCNATCKLRVASGAGHGWTSFSFWTEIWCVLSYFCRIGLFMLVSGWVLRRIRECSKADRKHSRIRPRKFTFFPLQKLRLRIDWNGIPCRLKMTSTSHRGNSFKRGSKNHSRPHCHTLRRGPTQLFLTVPQ